MERTEIMSNKEKPSTPKTIDDSKEDVVLETTSSRIRSRLKTFLKEDVKEIISRLFELALIAALVLTLRFTVGFIAMIPTSSMVDTIPYPSAVLCLRTPYYNGSPSRGDIVVFNRSDYGDNTMYIKRIIGTPGDKVEIVSGVTYINDTALDEPYLLETPDELDFGPFYLDDGCYFMMGDNRNNSYDCRYWEEHSISRGEIKAEAAMVLYPFSNFGEIKEAQ